MERDSSQQRKQRGFDGSGLGKFTFHSKSEKQQYEKKNTERNEYSMDANVLYVSMRTSMRTRLRLRMSIRLSCLRDL